MNLVETKDKIIKYIQERGPSLPVHITKITGMNLTFTSAILSELLADRLLKTSNLKVGSSVLYYVQGQEKMLENFISNLKIPEREAFNKLKQNKILDDEKQDPVTRVALRSIRDFAVPLKHKEKLYWKYHLLSDEKASEAISGSEEKVQAVGQRVIGQQIWEDIQKQQISKENIEEMVKNQVMKIAEEMNKNSQKTIEEKQVVVEEKPAEKIQESQILENQEKFQDIEIQQKTSEIQKKVSVPRKTKKISVKDLFAKEAEFTLKQEGYVLQEVLKSDKDKFVARVSKENEFLAVVYNKKRVDEASLLRDLKKFESENLNFRIFLKQELAKKVSEKIQLLKKIQGFVKIQEQ